MKTLGELIEGITKPVSIGVVVKRANSARSSIVGNNISPSQIAKSLQKALKGLGVEVTFEFVPALQSGDMSANAFYDQEADLEGDPAIEVQLLFSSKDKKINLDNEGFDVLSKEIAKVIVHEMLHKSQAIKRGFVKPRPFTVKGVSEPKIAKAQKYMGNSDEIEAYGHNALTALKNFVKIPPDKSPDMFAYLTVFGMDKNHPVLKKLVKKVILYLRELEK